MKDTIVFVDIETTGTILGTHEIIDIGAIRADYNTLEVQEVMEYKIFPKDIQNANPIALRVNGYNEDYWKTVAVDLEIAMHEFNRISSGAIPCGHNVGFDLRFIMEAFQNLGIRHSMINSKIDTMKVAKNLIPPSKIPKYSLSEVCTYLGLQAENKNAHEALNGAKAAFNVFATLRDLKSQRVYS